MHALVWSNQHGQWWRPARRGYTSVIEEAGRYSIAEAREIVAQATLDGQLTRTALSPITGEHYATVDEVLVPAPECLAEILDAASGRPGRHHIYAQDEVPRG